MDQPKPDLEKDLLNSNYIREKAYRNQDYCQNLYAALCNNEWIKADVLSILAAEHWHCSWRYAGGIAAGLHNGSGWEGQDDYMEFYLLKDFSGSDYSRWFTEGIVTDEIREDFKRIGWYLVENKVNDVS